MNADDTVKQSDWLLNVEQNSWQIELLISGGLLITLYYLPNYINEWLAEVVNDSQLTTAILLIFLVALIVSKALLIGFGTNLFLRSMWLASIGVHYAFPEGIKDESLDYHKDIIDKLTPKDGPHHKVLLLEKLSSLSYSISIILTVFSMGAALIVLAFYFLLFEPFFPSSVYDSKVFGYTFYLIVVLVSIGAVDHFILNRLRNSRSRSLRYLNISNWISYLNLTKLFKYEWRVLTSHITRWKLYGVCIAYLSIAVVLSLSDISWSSLSIDVPNPLDHRKFTDINQSWLALQNNEYLENYENGEYIKSPVIPSEVINTSYLSVFLPYDQWYDYGMEVSLDYHNAIWSPDYADTSFNRLENFYKVQNTLNEVHRLSIDQKFIDSTRWYLRELPNTGQLGFQTRIDIDSLDRGAHTLMIYYVQRVNNTELDTFSLRWIPFWKE